MTDNDIAKNVLTQKELDAWTLIQRGLSIRATALALNVSRTTIKDRLLNSQRKIATHRRKGNSP